jgi:hypothetical protein
MREYALQATADAIYALLSMVSNKGEATVEAGRQPSQMPLMSLGYCSGFLELLRVVP